MARRRGSPMQALIGLLGLSLFWLYSSWNKLEPASQILVVVLIVLVLLAVGTIGWLVAKRSFRRLKALGTSHIDSMSGLEFENYVATLFRHRGYTATVTPASGDLGIDIVLFKDGIKYGVQVKRYSKPVSRRAVSDVVGALNHYKCQSAMVVTNNYFTPGAKELAKSNNCQLVDRDMLADWISDFQMSLA
ncbi:MAG: restriction endonuclease [Blastocatellia bacterium]